ncbi:hypothetical protein [Amycolatopsis sulphurea]|uniref:hypothetical protein n=1 Tax=Amycolatopsis sulphurea TaxID=76022 RepID=UPI001145D96E|nr:hypothetical protein [Amycolatopsis sulphurea]
MVTISPPTPNKNGLEDLYSNKAGYKYFEPATSEGYPGVFGSPLGDSRSEGLCNLTVGVTGPAQHFGTTGRSAQPDDVASAGLVNRPGTASAQTRTPTPQPTL